MVQIRLTWPSELAAPRLLPQLALLVAFGALFAILPLLTLILICLLCVSGLGRAPRLVFLLSSCLLFCILNISKEIEGDLINYVNIHEFFTAESISTFLDDAGIKTVAPSYRATEPGFYASLWALAQLFSGARAAIAIAATLATYLPLFLGLRIIGKQNRWNERLTLVVAFVVFFLGINFNLTTHLLRQHVSGSVAFLAFAYFVTGRTWLAAFLAVVSCSIHNGTALIVVDFACLAWLFPCARPIDPKIWRMALRIAGALIIFVGSAAAIAVRELAHLGFLETDITAWHFAAAGVLFGVFLYSMRLNPSAPRTNYYASMCFMVIFGVSVGYYITGLLVLALRYFLYLDWLFGLIVASALCVVPRRNVGVYLASRWLACCAAVLVFLLRIHNSAWAYGAGELDLFTENARGVAEFITN